MIRMVNQVFAIVLWIAALAMLVDVSMGPIGVAALVLAPFALWPQAVTHIGIGLAKRTNPQGLLTAALLIYFLQFTRFYFSMRDAGPGEGLGIAPLVFLMLGFIALPYLGFLWVAAVWIETRSGGEPTGPRAGEEPTELYAEGEPAGTDEAARQHEAVSPSADPSRTDP